MAESEGGGNYLSQILPHLGDSDLSQILPYLDNFFSGDDTTQIGDLPCLENSAEGGIDLRELLPLLVEDTDGMCGKSIY